MLIANFHMNNFYGLCYHDWGCLTSQAGYGNLIISILEEEIFMAINLIATLLFIITFAVVVLLVYLIPLIKQLQKTAESAEKTINNMERELIPLIQQTKQTIQEINQITTGLREQVVLFENVIANFRSLAERTHQLTSVVYDQIEMPIINLLNNITAIKKGFNTFTNTLFSRRKEG